MTTESIALKKVVEKQIGNQRMVSSGSTKMNSRSNNPNDLLKPHKEIQKLDSGKGRKRAVYDSKKSEGSLAIIQKHLKKISEFSEGTIGKEFRIKKIEIKSQTNQVRNPEECGVMAKFIVIYLALELPGEPVFQIFAKDWINWQRYYTTLNLEIGYMKMEIGKSGMAVEEEEVARETERNNIMMWQKADEEMGTSVFNSHIDNCDKNIIRGAKNHYWTRNTSKMKESSMKLQMRSQRPRVKCSTISVSITRLCG
ncbi:hypothetical protein OXYTRIMIC_484 [Oxytricha trifallax]|uniref:Ubiquitin-like protease family profile domain-containing protein n=1 Tax=Oxytricha trifallax TaxID=1172189 RepID=A0A073HWW5_9SPIT|nr:hypothetical protein OXYTRIMIC_484 [Oxytricha trifallax]